MCAYKQFSLFERNRIEEGLNEHLSFRKIADMLGRQTSSISREVKANRSVLKGRGKKPECTMKIDCRIRGLCTTCSHDDRYCQHCRDYDCRVMCDSYIDKTACKTLASAPWVCNSCKRYRYGCTRPLRLEYRGIIAESLATTRRSEARQGFDMELTEFEQVMDIVRPALARGMSPYEISVAFADQITVSASTLYRWIDSGYGGMANIELERKVGFAPRKHKPQKRITHHGTDRSYEAFCALSEEEQLEATELDTVEGRKGDNACILTLYSRPSHFQFYKLIAEQTTECVVSALDVIEQTLGLDLFLELFGLMLTDNGHEFEDTEALEASVTQPGKKRCRVFYCDPRQSQQKPGCEKNHTELRQVLPKGSVYFDTLSERDVSLACSHVNSNPRKSLCGLTPIKMLATAYGDVILAALWILGINEVGVEELTLKPRLLNDERARLGLELLDFNPPKSR